MFRPVIESLFAVIFKFRKRCRRAAVGTFCIIHFWWQLQQTATHFALNFCHIIKSFTDPKALAGVVAAVRKATTIPLITKLSPNVSRIADFALAAQDAGSDILSLINTIPAMTIDVETRRPKIANVTGGMSGPAVKPVAIKLVYEASKAVSIPIIGMGGIMNGLDAVEFLLAGASAVAVGTAIFADPRAPLRVIEELDAYLDSHGIASVSELVGQVRLD